MRHQTAPAYSVKPFGEALGDLLREYQQSPLRANISAFGKELEPYGFTEYQLRNVLNGKKVLRRDLMEACAEVLGVHPSYFVEWRAMEIDRLITLYPGLAGQVYESALAIVEAWEEYRGSGESSS